MLAFDEFSWLLGGLQQPKVLRRLDFSMWVRSHPLFLLVFSPKLEEEMMDKGVWSWVCLVLVVWLRSGFRDARRWIFYKVLGYFVSSGFSQRMEVDSSGMTVMAAEMLAATEKRLQPVANGMVDLEQRVNSIINFDTRNWDLNPIRHLIDDRVVEAISKIKFASPRNKDRLMWPFEKNGLYSVKSGYHWLHSSSITQQQNRPSSSGDVDLIC
ncbi:hypothetical protein L3X38_035621 [Prunus dulcis]|uniref:Uncharacterized protein n=1 Tax=Prunus dulcis TaxID=3755 RepID=A0AAD4VLS9_PRUDU|nr:hypothetical protein L3X38_035621 [Prunus dulcis]